MDTHEFLKALTIVLCTAGLTTVLFQWLRQPVVLGYMLAGLIVGPYVPVPLIADREVVQTLSEVGVILLMFSLGLEFSLRKLARVGPAAGLTAVIQTSVMFWLGFVAGQAFGWTVTESIFTGALIAISSTTIIAKAFDEQGVSGKLRELVVGVLIVEDLIAILMLAILTAVASGAGLSAGSLVQSSARLGAFLVGLIVIGLLVVPRAVRAVTSLRRAETTLVASIGLCFAFALLAVELGYSVALGAFLAGSLVAESGEEKEVERLVHPVRDMFAAIFFVSVGMLIDPAVIARHWPAVGTLTAIVIAGKVIGVSLGAFLTGNGIRMSVQAGMSLAQIGEFSFIIAALGVSLRATGEFLYPIAVAVSALTTLTTPWLIRGSDRAAALLDDALPRPLQTFTALYGSWLERLRAAPRRVTVGQAARRLVKLLALDGAALAAVVIGASVAGDTVTAFLSATLGLSETASRALLVLAAALLAAPFVVGILGVSHRLGVLLAETAFPKPELQRVDTALAPRRALMVTLYLAAALLIGLPLVALTQPFLPGTTGALVFALVLLVLGVGFWRSTTNLQGHVRAGAQVIASALGAQARRATALPDARPRVSVSELLPGLGEPEAVRLEPAGPAVGRTLAQLNVRGLTGATVLAIIRGSEVILPTPDETLQSGDVLALTGTREAVEAAKQLLTSGLAERAGNP